MPVYTIPIHGLIGSPESKEDTQKYFQFSDLLLHINKAQMFDELNLDFSSDGGFVDEADKMIDVLKKTKKRISCTNSGNVCSAASKMFTIAPKELRSFNPNKGIFLIHNPFGKIEGDASVLAHATKALEEVENNYVKWYANATGSDENVIRSFMAENVPLTPDQIEQLGFATIVRPVINAVAKLKSLNNDDTMDNKEVIEKLNAFEKILKGFEGVMAKFRPKAIMIADANGKELEFPDLTDPSEIAVGVKVNDNGKPANGEYPQADGSTFVCTNGVLAEIKPAEGDEMQALKDEIAALKTENESLKAEKVSAEAKITEAVTTAQKISAEFKKFKAEFSSGDPGGDQNEGGQSEGSKKVTKEDLEKMLN